MRRASPYRPSFVCVGSPSTPSAQRRGSDHPRQPLGEPQGGWSWDCVLRPCRMLGWHPTRARRGNRYKLLKLRNFIGLRDSVSTAAVDRRYPFGEGGSWDWCGRKRRRGKTDRRVISGERADRFPNFFLNWMGIRAGGCLDVELVFASIWITLVKPSINTSG